MPAEELLLLQVFADIFNTFLSLVLLIGLALPTADGRGGSMAFAARVYVNLQNLIGAK